MSLSEDVLSHLFHFFCSMQDACRFLIAINIKPNGIYCELLRRAFVTPTNQPFSYRKFNRYIYKANGKMSALAGYKIVDTRYIRKHPVIFTSNALQLTGIQLDTRTKWKCHLNLQDPTGFYHLRMKGFIHYFCKSNDYKASQFEKFFGQRKLTVMSPKLHTCFTKSRYNFDQYVILTFAIYFDPIEQLFFPFASCFQFLSR